MGGAVLDVCACGPEVDMQDAPSRAGVDAVRDGSDRQLVPGDRRGGQECRTEVRLAPQTQADSDSCGLASLVKIDDDRLQALLDEIQTMRKFQS